MFYKKTDPPEEGDIVLCTVKDVTHNSVFLTLEEYKEKEGIIHISEISPGRIRNIRDFVKEGKKIVCKILKSNPERNYFEMSLRRVNQSQRINKNNEYKQEQKAEKILDMIAKKEGKKLEEMYDELGYKILKEFGLLYVGFQEISENPALVKNLKLVKKTETTLLEIVQEKIKPSKIEISAKIKIQNNAYNGIEIIKEILMKMKRENVALKYISAPLYRITIESNDYKKAEAVLKEITEQFEKNVKEQNCEGEITKEK